MTSRPGGGGGAVVLLWDAHDAATRILRDTDGLALADYVARDLLRDAVERRFITVGEALGALRRRAPDVAARVPRLAEVVAFRNLLVHGYGAVRDDAVWRTTREDLPVLVAALAELLREMDAGGVSDAS